jgi:hypothetical protein
MSHNRTLMLFTLLCSTYIFLPIEAGDKSASTQTYSSSFSSMTRKYGNEALLIVKKHWRDVLLLGLTGVVLYQQQSLASLRQTASHLPQAPDLNTQDAASLASITAVLSNHNQQITQLTELINHNRGLIDRHTDLTDRHTRLIGQVADLASNIHREKNTEQINRLIEEVAKLSDNRLGY